ncbi:hypothetical protein BFJ72_g15358, partial [Fusarium proliferatum]
AQRLAQFLKDRQTCLGSSPASAGKYNQESWDDYERAWTMLLGMAAPAAPVAAAVPDAAYCALQYVEHALAAIANREELADGAFQPMDSIGKASKRAKAALARLQSVAHHFSAAAAPAAPAGDATSDTALLDAMQRHRIALVPEFEGPWDAEIFNDEAEAHPIASGNTPREALRAAIAAQAKEGGA